MLEMGHVYVIRHKHFTEGMSIRRIAKDLGISRNTVRKYLFEDSEPNRKEPSARSRPVLENASGRIEELLSEWNCRTTPKQLDTDPFIVLRCTKRRGHAKPQQEGPGRGQELQHPARRQTASEARGDGPRSSEIPEAGDPQLPGELPRPLGARGRRKQAGCERPLRRRFFFGAGCGLGATTRADELGAPSTRRGRSRPNGKDTTVYTERL
jgi:transcriptional regulator with XRE-family HTH domain